MENNNVTLGNYSTPTFPTIPHLYSSFKQVFFVYIVIAFWLANVYPAGNSHFSTPVYIIVVTLVVKVHIINVN